MEHSCKTELQSSHLRVTPARLATLQLLASAKKPLDVATIQSALNDKGITTDPATVFRMMHTFSDKGLVREVQLQESKLRYEHADTTDHHHLLCERCGTIADISDCNVTDLETEIMQKKGFFVKRHSLEFFGLCKDCREKS